MSSCLPWHCWGIRCASQAPWSVWSLSTSIEVTWTVWIRTPIGFWWFGSKNHKNHGFDAKKLDVYPVKFSRWPWYLQKKNVFRCGEVIEISSKKWRLCFGAPSEVFDGYTQDLATGRSCTWPMRFPPISLLAESLCFLNKDLHKLLVNPVKWPYMDVCISGR